MPERVQSGSAPPVDLAAALQALADRVDSLDIPQVLGELEALRFRVWMAATSAPLTTSDEDTLLDAAGVAATLGVPEKQARKLMAARAFPVVRVGARYIRVHRSDLHAYVAARRTGLVPSVAPAHTIPHDKGRTAAASLPHLADDPTRVDRRPRRPAHDRVSVRERLESDPADRRHRHHAPRGKADGGAPLDVGAVDPEL